MNRIAVTPADEDEVIIAGGGPAEAPASISPAPAGEAGPASAAEPARVSEDAAAAGRASRDAAATAPASRGRYRETMLDDLEPSPMPLAQRVVIVAAVVCIIGALVYYFVAMR